MAWGLLQNAWTSPSPAPQVSSAGLMAETGSPPVSEAVLLLQERGIDISIHRARQATETLFREQDLILVMETWQKSWVARRWPHLAGRVYLLGHWGGFEIGDPYGGGMSVFRDALEAIERGIETWKPYLEERSPAQPDSRA